MSNQLPVSKAILENTIKGFLDNADLNTLQPIHLRNHIIKKHQLNPNSLDEHRELISEIMGKCLNTMDMDDEMDTFNQHLQQIKKQKPRLEKTSQAKTGNNILDIGNLNKSWHIFEDNNGIEYSVLLNQTNLEKNNNKFYAIQLLEHYNNGLYLLITKWGRVGKKGQRAEVQFDTPQQGINEFAKKFKSKTKNDWGTKKFIPKKGKYTIIDVSNNNDNDSDSDIDMDFNNNNDDDIKIDDDDVRLSKLSKSIQNILELIFDKQLALDTLSSFDIDLNRMPLGKLSNKQIESGYKYLCQLNDIIVRNNNNGGILSSIDNSKLLEYSNKFYTLIPHDFGMKRPPIINSIKKVHKKIELIQALKDAQITSKILQKQHKNINPIDIHYKALHCDINDIHKDSIEYINIKKSIEQTHGSTHDTYTLTLLNIYEINRNGSDFRHLPFKSALNNKQLLWHGTRLSNVCSILAQGLKIAPPEAPSTGFMFGKGLYFADVASKSANYIHANNKHPYGILLLCEVALGNIYELLKSKYLIKPPNGYHSVKGSGKMIPNEENNIIFNQYQLNLGPLIETNNNDIKNNSKLKYNEYIVYDIAQLKIKYLCLVKFNFV